MDENAIWQDIKLAIESGEESPKIDLKEKIDLDSNEGKAKFIKNLSAIANTPGGKGYLVIGVRDKKNRNSEEVAEFIVGIEMEDIDEFNLRIVQILREYIDPDPYVKCYKVPYPSSDKNIGVIVIPESKNRPHLIKKDISNLREGQVFVRRGSRPFPASRNELIDMTAEDLRIQHKEELEQEREKFDKDIKKLNDDIQSKDDEIAYMQEENRNLKDDNATIAKSEMEWRQIAQSACKQLYTNLPRESRGERVRRLLNRYDKENSYPKWFPEEVL